MEKKFECKPIKLENDVSAARKHISWFKIYAKKKQRNGGELSTKIVKNGKDAYTAPFSFAGTYSTTFRMSQFPLNNPRSLLIECLLKIVSSFWSGDNIQALFVRYMFGRDKKTKGIDNTTAILQGSKGRLEKITVFRIKNESNLP